VSGVPAPFGLPELFAGIIVVALNVYVLTGGADFGAGVWDLFASGPRRNQQRDFIAHTIGPIWEANHVWLVLVVVLTFTAFPAAFATLGTVLHIPLALMLVGIVLRGAAFTFRAYDEGGVAVERRWGLIFSMSSVLAPLMLGAIVGALSSGRLRLGPAGEPLGGSMAWLSWFSAATGLLATALFAFLAAVYLTVEARGELLEDFRRRAIAAGVVTFLAAATAAGLSWRESPLVFEGLTARAWSLPLHAATGLAACGAFWALVTRRFVLARFLAAAQATLIVLGWGASQYPYLLVPDVTLASAAAPPRTLALLLGALGLGALTLIPSLWLLFRVFKRRARVADPRG
jgi:cytochrome bd ubiquinol oxidase subunit II